MLPITQSEIPAKETNNALQGGGGWILVLERDKQDQAQHKLGGLLSQLTTGGVSDFGKMCGFWIFP